MTYYQDESVTIHHGDCLDVLATLPDASVDSVVTDPPYGLEFMGKEWDSFAPDRTQYHGERADTTKNISDDRSKPSSRHRVSFPMGRPTFRRCTECGKREFSGSPCRCDEPTWTYEQPTGTPTRMAAFETWCEQWATECLRVLKPGGHMLAFGGSRTWHRLASAIEDAGFEIRDSIAWLHSQGFPKNLDVAKAIDRAAGAEREVVGDSPFSSRKPNGSAGVHSVGLSATPGATITAPATDDARTWQGWGTALKPAHEPLVHGVKPLVASDMSTRIGSHIDRMESEWQALAADPQTRTGEAADSPAQTDTSWFESARTTFSNIVTSWRNCLAELSEQTNTSTTRTAAATTTDLRTLLSSISSLTATNMLRAETRPPGLTQRASAVDNLFASAVFASRATRALSVAEPATANTPTSRQDAAGSQAFEPIVVGRKPLAGTVAQTVLTHGTGALNIDGCRVGTSGATTKKGQRDGTTDSVSAYGHGLNGGGPTPIDAGRWPANVVLDQDAAAELDRQSGTSDSVRSVRVQPGGVIGNGHTHGAMVASRENVGGFNDSGGASRFFPTFRYEAKAPTAERPRNGDVAHPTVKPLELMRWLVRLVTPHGGVVLEPFAGSGTTVEAAVREGMRCIAIEREADYLPLIMSRLARPIDLPMFGDVS